MWRCGLFVAGDIKSLSPEKSPIAMKDVKWHTHNSSVGFLVSGESTLVKEKSLDTKDFCLINQ